MTKKRTSKKPKVVWVGNTPITPITAQQSRELDRRIQERRERLRKRYPEVHGRVVDYIRIPSTMERCSSTSSSRIRRIYPSVFACEIFIVAADFGDTRTGDLEIVRKYMKPILG